MPEQFLKTLFHVDNRLSFGRIDYSKVNFEN